MTETILVPIDGSDPAGAALEFALDRFPEGHVIVYHAINPLDVAYKSGSEAVSEGFWSHQLEHAKQRSREILEEAEEHAEGSPAEVELDAEVGPATESIVEYADTRDVDQLVLGSHGRTGVERVVLGSVAEKVVRRAPAPVTVVHGDDV